MASEGKRGTLTRRIRLEDVAAQCGVSVSTASRALAKVRGEADALAPAFGLLAEGNRAKRAPMRIGLKLNTLIDSTSSHLGEMLLQGYVMGIIDMTRAQREYPAEDKDILGLAKKLVETEDANFLAIREWL